MMPNQNIVKALKAIHDILSSVKKIRCEIPPLQTHLHKHDKNIQHRCHTTPRTCHFLDISW